MELHPQSSSCSGGRGGLAYELAKPIVSCRAHPLFITGTRALVGATAVYQAVKGDALGGLALFAVFVFLDSLDGCTARECGTTSESGAIVDQAADVALGATVYTLLVFGLLYHRVRPHWGIPALIILLFLQVLFLFCKLPGDKATQENLTNLGSILWFGIFALSFSYGSHQ